MRVNTVVSITGLALYASAQRPRIGHLARDIATNPLIVSVLVGVALNQSGIGLPWVVAPILDILGDAALPLALLAVGAGLDLGAIRATGRTVLATTAVRMLVMPLLATAAAMALPILRASTASQGRACVSSSSAYSGGSGSVSMQ